MQSFKFNDVFQGKFEHSLDEKGRLAIPAHFRKKLESTVEGEHHVILTLSDRCIAAYPEGIWRQKLELLSRMNQLNPEVMQFKRIFVGCAQECLIDKSGRILVPNDLREQVGISKECIVLGQLEKFEIWSHQHWTSTYSSISDQVSQIYAKMGAMGLML